MSKQYIISISREFGSGGHAIAEELANRLGIKMYDRHILDEIATKLNMSAEDLEKYDEKPRNKFFSRRVRNYSNSMEEVLAEMVFDYIREKAKSGESFVIVGRAADIILENDKSLVKIFVCGNKDAKIERVMQRYNLDAEEAYEKCLRHDKYRKKYHNNLTDKKWGDSRNYDMCINSNMGVDTTVDVLEYYIKNRIK